VQPGEIFGFLGPNGSGKTTTIRMMLGLLTPSEGHVSVLQIPVTEKPAAIRTKVGYMSQHFSLYNDLTVEQNLRFYGTAYGLANEALAEAMKKAIKLSGLKGREGVKTSALSGGWRQRLALSAAILHKPQVLFLDEPTAGVDPVSRREFWELLYRLVSEGVTVFVTTHYMDEAEHCHRLALIQRGKLMAVGSPTELKERIIQDRIFELFPDDPAGAMKTLRQAQSKQPSPLKSVELYGAAIHVGLGEVADAETEIKSILKQNNIDPGVVRQIEPSLEDVFIASME
jgi:ABC-2 type transport system ATP-binding protein